jgi:3-oxoacyl-[acyl-carrier protein] reductase
LNKTIIITGAGRGIGLATVEYLAQDHHVIGISRQIEQLNGLKNVVGFRCDLTSVDDIAAFTSFLNEKELKIDGLINNAGSLVNKPFEDLTDDDWQHSFDINVFGPVKLIRSLLPYMNSDAHIVNISSMGGYQGSSKYPGLSAYSASKGALSILSECLAAEFETKQISVNCLCLGAVQTEMLAEAFPGYDAPIKPHQMGKFIGDFLLNSATVMNGKVIPVTMSNP